MRWKRGTGRRWIEDRRGQRTGGLALPVGGGIGGMGLLILLVVLALTGGLPGGNGSPSAGGSGQPAQLDSDLEQFVAFVVDDVQQGWIQAFRESGREYEPTKLVLFEQSVSSGCGVASSATGPARSTRRSTSTWASSASFASASARRATSPRPT